MMVMNQEFDGIQELTLEEIEQVNGGWRILGGAVLAGAIYDAGKKLWARLQMQPAMRSILTLSQRRKWKQAQTTRTIPIISALAVHSDRAD